MSRATNAAMDGLHGLMASGMTDEMRRAIARAQLPVTIPDPEDPKKSIRNPEYAPLDTKLLAVSIKFLKDNGIDVPAAAERFDGLAAELRDLDLDEVASQRPN